MTDIGQIENTAAALLLGAAVVAIVARRTGMPYTVALVIAGLVTGVSGWLPEVRLSHDLILFVFVPPLIFEGAINMDLRELTARWAQVGALAIGGTLITAAAVALLLRLALGWDPAMAILVGVMVAPTDPVSVLATLKESGVAVGLRTLLEGESIFNDGLGIVLFEIAVRYAYPLQEGRLSASGATATAAAEIGIAAAVGIGTGLAVHYLMRSVRDNLIEQTLSVALALGSFLIANELGGSGVIAVALAGLLIGNFGTQRAMSPASQQALLDFWEIASFLMNSALFLLIGLSLRSGGLLDPSTLAAIAAITAGLHFGRALACYGMLWLLRRRPLLPPTWRHAIFAGGLRGSIPIALAFGLTDAERTIEGVNIVTVVFGVVLVSLLTQGLSFSALLRRLQITQPT